MLCGRRISELLGSRREQACGLLAASSSSRASVRSVRFKRGRPALLSRPGRGGRVALPLQGILRPPTRSCYRAGAGLRCLRGVRSVSRASSLAREARGLQLSGSADRFLRRFAHLFGRLLLRGDATFDSIDGVKKCVPPGARALG